jgi:hypothetical protein
MSKKLVFTILFLVLSVAVSFFLDSLGETVSVFNFLLQLIVYVQQRD